MTRLTALFSGSTFLFDVLHDGWNLRLVNAGTYPHSSSTTLYSSTEKTHEVIEPYFDYWYRLTWNGKRELDQDYHQASDNGGSVLRDHVER